MCADDVMLLSDTSKDLQAQLNIITDYERRERYHMNPTKTTISEYPGKRRTTHEHPSWTFGDSVVTPTDQFTHLGIIRTAGKFSPDAIIDAMIQLASRTCYSLMGAGLHGSNGISPVVAWSMYSTYVLPRLLYNLEVLILTPSQTAVLERFHRATLRSIQGLPERTSSAATYLLLGALPVTAILHARILQLVGKISMARDTFLHYIAAQQLAVKDTSSMSWFIMTLKLAAKYSLPLPHELLTSYISLGRWHTMVNMAIKDYWERSMLRDATSKSTLSLLIIETLAVGHPHPAWTYVQCQMKDIACARIKCKLLTGTYMLQTNRAKFNANDVDPTCPLCKEDLEDTTHFIASCSASHHVRSRYLTDLGTLVLSPPAWNVLIWNPAALTQSILDTNHTVGEGIITKEAAQDWDFYTRLLCFNLHINRRRILDATATSLQCRKAAPT